MACTPTNESGSTPRAGVCRPSRRAAGSIVLAVVIAIAGVLLASATTDAAKSRLRVSATPTNVLA